MTYIWLLHLTYCTSMFWWGHCGAQIHEWYNSEAACYHALDRYTQEKRVMDHPYSATCTRSDEAQ